MNNATLLKTMKWLCVQDMIKYRISCLIHQIIYTKTPAYLYHILITNNVTNTRNKLGNKLGTKPANIGKTYITKIQFCARSYEIYNSIPSIITSIENKYLFKKYLKRYLFNERDLPDPNKYKITGLMDGLK